MQNKNQTDLDRVGSVITFYSYKGGVGRTMALANLACLLSKAGKKVLLIDWDLEAPGLHHFFIDDNKDQDGLIDLMTEINNKILNRKIKNEDIAYIEYFNSNIKNFIVADFPVSFKGDRNKYSIDLMKSGKFDSSYSSKIIEFNWINFYSNSPSFFRTFANFLGTIYDYVLIDSRTGFADTSGICTMLMPERLVLIFAPNDQNLEGVLDVAKQARTYRINSLDDRTLAIYPLPSRIDSNNTTQRPIWLNKYTKWFKDFFIENYHLDSCNLKYYFEKSSIRYIHDYAFGENLPVLSESITDNKNISNDYNNFLSILIQDEPIWELPTKARWERSIADGVIYDNYDEFIPNIKVIGVGGGGSNAVSRMYEQRIRGVEFFVCNTDSQSLSRCVVPNKIKLGNSGLGAGANPSIGRDAAVQIADEIKEILSLKTSLLFIVAGMGGGTGTGASPVIAKIAHELDILTIGIVTKPFGFEGKKREAQAYAGISELMKWVDTLIEIPGDKLLESEIDMKLSQAFGKADDILATAVKGIAEIMTVPGRINVDFDDIKSILKDSGNATMSMGIARGPDRAVKAVEMALNSFSFHDTNIYEAQNVMLYITSGKLEISLEELNDITGYITTHTHEDANVIWGDGFDNRLVDEISITLIATGFREIKDIHHPTIIEVSSSNISESENDVNYEKEFDRLGKLRMLSHLNIPKEHATEKDIKAESKNSDREYMNKVKSKKNK